MQMGKIFSLHPKEKKKKRRERERKAIDCCEQLWCQNGWV